MGFRSSTPVPVAEHLQPARTFDVACARVVRYLARVVPMGVWAVTRMVDGRQVWLHVDCPAPEYPLAPGVEFPVEASLCSIMLTGDGPQIAPDVRLEPAYADAAQRLPLPVGAYLGLPIVHADGEVFGSVCGYDPLPLPESLRDHLPLLDLLSSLLSTVLEADCAAVAAERAADVARQEADTDGLTGLLNRRGWDRVLAREEERYRRFGDPACVVVLDLDRLKTVNDTLGHEAGDRYIRRAAQVLAAHVRDVDVLARLGGDEFGVLAAGASVPQTAELITRLERALEDAGVSGSFGHAPYGVLAGFPGAWQAADEAMYEQKRLRRSRTGRHRAPDPERADAPVSGN